jgi:hypothetical protein
VNDTTALVQPATVMASQDTTRHRCIVAINTADNYIQAIYDNWPTYFYAPESYRESELQYMDPFNDEDGPWYLYYVDSAQSLREATNREGGADLGELIYAMNEEFTNGHRTFWGFLEPLVSSHLSGVSLGDVSEPDEWVRAYFEYIKDDGGAGAVILRRLQHQIGGTEEARQHYEAYHGDLSGGGQHESDIVIAQISQNKIVDAGKAFMSSSNFLHDPEWGDGEIYAADADNIVEIIERVAENGYGGQELRDAVAVALLPSSQELVNLERVLEFTDDEEALAFLIDHDYDLYKDIVRNNLQESLHEWEYEKAYEAAYASALSDFANNLGQDAPPSDVDAMDWLRDHTVADLRSGTEGLDDILNSLTDWILTWQRDGIGDDDGWEELLRLHNLYQTVGFGHPETGNIMRPYYYRYERVVLLSTYEAPLDDPSLEGQRGTYWGSAEYQTGTDVQLDDGRIVIVDENNIFSEEYAPHEPQEGQQTLPFVEGSLKAPELDPTFFEDGKLRPSMRVALRKVCGDSFAAFLLLDSINGMRTSPVLNVAAVMSDSTGKSIKSKINGRPVVVHATEEDASITWRDAVYDLDHDFWLVPMRSMIALKPEDEIDIGDHVEVGLHSHPATITDKHESEEYRYDLYTYKEDDGEEKTVEKIQIKPVDDNPLRLLPKENDSIVMPKTAQINRTAPKFQVNDIVLDAGNDERRVREVYIDEQDGEWKYSVQPKDDERKPSIQTAEDALTFVSREGQASPPPRYWLGEKIGFEGEGNYIRVDDIYSGVKSFGKWKYFGAGKGGWLHFVDEADAKPFDNDPVTGEDEPVIARKKDAASGGTGYGDYQEKITDTSGTGVGGDVSSSHAPPDFAPFDPEEQSKEGSPVPSAEYKKTLMKNRIIKDSVAGRKADVLASKIVTACKSHMIRKSQTDQGVSTYNTTLPAQPSAPIKNVPVAGNGLGGGYQIDETQQDELDANISENENVNRTQFQQEQGLQQEQMQDQQQANDLQQVFQQQKVDESNKQQNTVARRAEAAKLKILFGSEHGFENPADSTLDDLEEDDDQTHKSSTDHGRKVFLHEEYSDEDVQSSVTYPRHRDEVKPRY